MIAGDQSAPSWEEVRAYLEQAEPAFFELEPGGALALQLPNEDWVLEMTPDGRLICQTGIDMEDVSSLLSDGTPEDLGSDELAKQAKYYLQPTVSRFRQMLLAAGFQENTEMTDQHVAATFERKMDFRNLSQVVEVVRWCQLQIKP